jgi:toxin ParE1/3/4
MSKAIRRRRAAGKDLVEIFRYLAHEGGLRVAERFLTQVEATFVRLAKMPGMGGRYGYGHPALADLRYFPVSRFPKYIVFYQPVAGGIRIIRVLHGARDIAGILAEEFGVEDDTGDDAADHPE